MIYYRKAIKNPYSLAAVVLLIIAATALLSSAREVWPFTIDDSFITFRYSSNLANGYGPTFNQVLPRAEGYTSFLWMLVMTIPHIIGFGVITFSKLVGLFFIFGTVVWMFVFLLNNSNPITKGYRVLAAAVVGLFFFLLPETAVHAVSGMETAMYTFVITGLTVLAYFGMQNCRWALNLLPVAALVAGLTRPEANLTALLLLSGVLAVLPQQRKFLIKILFFYILPGLIYFLWRWNYFGLLLPLPFYIKSGGFQLVGWSKVRSFLIFVLSNFGLYIGIGVLFERLAVRTLLLTILPNLFFFLFNYHVMSYSYRFLYPLLPAILILAGLGLAFLLQKLADMSPAKRSWLLPLWFAGLAVIMFSSQNNPRINSVFKVDLDYAQGMVRNHFAIGHALNRVQHEGEVPILVVGDAGAMPYYSGWRTIDSFGLNDPNIAVGGVDNVAYIFSHHPDVVVLTSNSLETYSSDSQYGHDLYNTALEQGLDVVVRSTFYQNDSIWVLARPDSEEARALKAQFGQ